MRDLRRVGCGMALALPLALLPAPPATAYPGDPAAGCETQVFAMYCDGPIRPDGTWQRCTSTAPSYTGGAYPVYVPPTYMCRVIGDPVPPLPLGQPPHHIDTA